jgi:thiamine monophosphate kinase
MKSLKTILRIIINPKNLDRAIKLIADNNGSLIPIGKVIAENEIYIIKDGEREILKEFGYEHFLTTRKK